MSLAIEIDIPEGIDCSLEGNVLRVKGGKGEILRDFFYPALEMKVKDGKITIKSKWKKDNKKVKAVMFTWRAHINNMFKGVQDGYEYQLKIYYVHFPMSVKVEGDYVVVSNFLGEKGVRKAKIVGNTEVSVKNDLIIVKGINKEEVGQTAANIEQITKNKAGRDRRKFLDGIYIVKKG